MPPVPARLHVLLARDTRAAVVIRRGPSRKVCVIGWDRDTDRFEVGQWFSGRIYERRCDLSPDGRHLLYFAMNGHWQSETLGSWTAISRAPYLRALGLWAKGDCWNGGGLFLSNDEIWLNDSHGHRVLRDDTSMTQRADYPWQDHFGGECPGVYYHRLQRDGWELLAREPDGYGGRTSRFCKRVDERWTLLKDARETLHRPPGRGCYFDEHSLRDERNGGIVPLPSWEWADLDGSRLVWAADGQIFAGRIGETGLDRPTLLCDFNGLRYERLAAPY